MHTKFKTYLISTSFTETFSTEKIVFNNKKILKKNFTLIRPFRVKKMRKKTNNNI